jgi:flagellar hook-basal body complex protein FliE
MAISPIGNVLGASGLGNINPAPKTNAVSGDFGDKVVGALENLEKAQDNADSLAVKAATGDLGDVHDYMIAATEASVQTEFTVAVRNKAVEAFNEIMRMQV